MKSNHSVVVIMTSAMSYLTCALSPLHVLARSAPIAAPTPVSQLKHATVPAAAPDPKAAAAKPNKRKPKKDPQNSEPKAKAVPKAKTAVQEATQVL